jgi:hypothetical protein
MTRAERIAAVADMRLGLGHLRLGLTGCSMLPSIAEPMVLQVAPVERPRIGDVLVFAGNGTRIAHRVIGIDGDVYRLSGDAQPHIIETIRHTDVLGTVVAIWADASTSARRIDDRLHRLRGWYYARFHGVRRAQVLALAKARDLVERARPRRRVRVATRLVDAIAAAARGDGDALAAALRCDAAALMRVDARHRCAAMLGEAARRLGVTGALDADIAARVREARLAAALRNTHMQRAVHDTVTVLRAARIECALLKGAARVYSAAPGAAQHASDDVDVFVREADVDRAAAALLAAGWHYRDPEHVVRRFRAHHHHAASLYSPAGDFPVELHHALAQPGTLSLDTTWEAMRPHLIPLDGSAGSVWQLDASGTALHLAIHAIGLTRLRDVALLAALLPRLQRDERRTLDDAVRRETADPIRLAASVALAARIAGVTSAEHAGVRRYIRWALQREDLPVRLRERSTAVEALFARPNAPVVALRQLVPWWSRGSQLVALPARVIARGATNAAAWAYATRLTGPEAGPLSE